MNPTIPYKLIASVVGGLLALGALCWLIGSRNHYKDAYAAEQTAHQATVSNYRAAAALATAADLKHKAEVEAEQRAVSERTTNEYQARIADVRARYERLRAAPSATPGRPGTAPVSVVSKGPSSATPAPAQGGLSPDDALTATEQAIQLDELIRWVNGQTKANDEHPSQ